MVIQKPAPLFKRSNGKMSSEIRLVSRMGVHERLMKGIQLAHYGILCQRNLGCLVKKRPCGYATFIGRHVKGTGQRHTTSRGKQAASNIGDKEMAPDIEELRRINCWRLWQERGFSVQDISFFLRMQPETVINNIFSGVRKAQNVDWCRLCKLVKITPDMAQSILMGRTKAKLKLPSSGDEISLSISDIQKCCPRNVTPLHIGLVHVMLGCGLSSSDIEQISKLAATDYDVKTADGTVNSREPVNLTSTDQGHVLEENCARKGTVKGANKELGSRPDNFNARGERMPSADTFASSGNKEVYDYIDEHDAKKKVVTMFGILQWLEKSNGATLYDIAKAFEGCDEIRLMRLLLNLVESSMIVRSNGKFRLLSNKCRDVLSKE